MSKQWKSFEDLNNNQEIKILNKESFKKTLQF